MSHGKDDPPVNSPAAPERVQARYNLPASMVEDVKHIAARERVTPNRVVESILADAIRRRGRGVRATVPA